MAQSTTPRTQFNKLYAANSTASSVTAPTPTLTEPTGDGFYRCGASGDEGNINYVDLRIFGAGADNTTGTGLLVGWRKAVDPSGVATALWIPKKLLSLAFTFGTSVGVAAAVAINTDRFADTITVATAYIPTSAYNVNSPADNSVASVEVDATGFDFIQFLPATGTATNVNGLAAGF